MLRLHHLPEEAEAKADDPAGKGIAFPLIQVSTAGNIGKENREVFRFLPVHGNAACRM